MKLTLTLLLLCKVIASCAVLYDSIENLPTVHYDFIVVGGGTAGNVVANRLTENPNWRVLVIESGPTHQGVLEPMVPFFWDSLIRSQYDWNFTTVPQPALGGRRINYARGRILGGTSSINAMFYTRGPSSDFDRYAKITGDHGWSWKNLQPYVKKNERWTAPEDDHWHNITGKYDPTLHSSYGTNAVTLAGYQPAYGNRFLDAAKELRHEYPFNLDINSGDPLGIGWMPQTINKGVRSSSATSYLAPRVLRRPNLDVIVNSRVSRIVQTGSRYGVPIFGAVDAAFPDSKLSRRVFASKEVIMSAGVFGTPQLLLNSGIGDSVELRSVGVQPVLHLPDVGKNFSDKPLLTLSWLVNATNSTTDDILRKPERYLQQWKNDKTGPLSTTGHTVLLWGRFADNSPIFRTSQDLASGRNTPDYEMIPFDGKPLLSENGRYVSVSVLVVSPTSRGSVSLKTCDPFDDPHIDVGLLSNTHDRIAIKEASKKAIQFMAASAWKDYIIGPAGPLENVVDDNDLDKLVSDVTHPGLHGVGTASMSPRGTRHGVVDPDLRVKGALGLRIVDASVIPFMPAAHTQAPVYIFAERGSDLIKQFWRI